MGHEPEDETRWLDRERRRAARMMLAFATVFVMPAIAWLAASWGLGVEVEVTLRIQFFGAAAFVVGAILGTVGLVSLVRVRRTEVLPVAIARRT